MNYWIDNLQINGQRISPNENPNTNLSVNDSEVFVAFDSSKRKIEVLSKTIQHSHYKKVKLIRDILIFPSNDNEKIGLACLVFITNNKNDDLMNFGFGPLIIRSNKLRSFPGKLSPAGGLHDASDCTGYNLIVKWETEKMK